jgi:Bor protein
MKLIVRSIVLATALAFVGCYHATVETGLASSNEVVHETFASCWIYGLVPPNTISVAAKCTHGVARVETQQSFVNGLVGAITLGIYTPMEIKVTCAAASGSAFVPMNNPDFIVRGDATEAQVREVFSAAADLAVATSKPVYVQY